MILQPDAHTLAGTVRLAYRIERLNKNLTVHACMLKALRRVCESTACFRIFLQQLLTIFVHGYVLFDTAVTYMQSDRL
jgi:hypothetical protein